MGTFPLELSDKELGELCESPLDADLQVLKSLLVVLEVNDNSSLTLCVIHQQHRRLVALLSFCDNQIVFDVVLIF